MEPNEFERAMEMLHQWHSEKHDTIQLYTTEVQKICTSSLLAAQIRHSPITHRIKTWDSAKQKVQQRNPPSLDDMKLCLHDFGGIRILVYLPGDVLKVVGILHEYFDVKREHTMKPRNRGSAIFAGYSATHLMVQLKESEIPQDKVAWKGVEVEIQVALLFMNVWSEIEHDMIYKPCHTPGYKISEDEERLLDLFNGIVMTGEVALRHLEATTQKRLNRETNHDHTAAFDWHGFAVWIGEYHRDRGRTLKDEWNGLRQLHSILDATGENQHKKFYGLLDAIYKDYKATATISRRILPSLLLKRFCEKDANAIHYVQPTGSKPLDRINFARDLGLQLLYSLSIAIYLGIGDCFSDITQIRHKFAYALPSLVEFLDLMHPTRPTYDRGTQVITRIAGFCQLILQEHSKDSNLKTCIELTGKGLIAHGLTSKGLSRIIFPSLLLRIFPLKYRKYSHRQCEWDDLDILDRIKHLCRNDQHASNDIVVRGKALSPELDEKLEWPLSKRFFLPTEPSSALEERWRLEDLQDELELKLVYDWKDEHRLDHLPEYADQYKTHTTCDALKLAYRMYPEEKYGMVFEAWENAYRPPTLSQFSQINPTVRSQSPCNGQHEMIKRESSPTPAKQSPRCNELSWDPSARPLSSHSDTSSRHEREVSPFADPKNTSRIWDRAQTLEPDLIRTDPVEPLRIPRSVTPESLNFSSTKRKTAVARATRHSTLKRFQPNKHLRCNMTPARSASMSPSPPSTTGMKRKVLDDSSESSKRRRLD